MLRFLTMAAINIAWWQIPTTPEFNLCNTAMACASLFSGIALFRGKH